MYTLKQEQQLYCTIDTAWDFFSNPFNLNEITPKKMGFRVLNITSADPIYEGMLIEYHVSPLFGIKLFWQTLIKNLNAPHSFIDQQRKGPYQFWEHKHEFIPNEDGVLMKDTIRYQVPFGLLGRIFHPVIRKKLEEIFAYRYQTLEKRFGRKND